MICSIYTLSLFLQILEYRSYPSVGFSLDEIGIIDISDLKNKQQNITYSED